MKIKLKTVVRVLLPVWVAVKIAAVLITVLSFGEIDLTFLNPAVELGFRALVFVDNTSLGLALFIGFVVIVTLGYPASFLVATDSKVKNIIGFFACSVVLLTDIISIFVIGFDDGMFVLSIVLDLAMIACLLYFGKRVILDRDRNSFVLDGDREEDEKTS